MSRPLDGFLGWVQRLLVLGGPSRPARTTTAATHPGAAASAVRRPTGAVGLASYVAVVAWPVLFGLALIPVRDRLEQSISLLMVLPVLLVAVLGGARLAAVAAVASAATFGVVHTEPYYRVTIEDADDVVEMVVLLVIGIVIGVITESAQRSVVAARVRRRELDAVTAFVDRIDRGTAAELVDEARLGITQLLSARDCEWRPGYRGTAAPVLEPDGSISTVHVAGLEERGDAATLPSTIEIPVGRRPVEQGRMVVRTTPEVEVSMEERRAAASIAAALGRYLDRVGG